MGTGLVVADGGGFFRGLEVDMRRDGGVGGVLVARLFGEAKRSIEWSERKKKEKVKVACEVFGE